LISFGLNSKTPLLFVVMITVTGGGGFGVGEGVGLGVGRGVGEGVGRGKGVGEGVGRAVGIGDGDGVACGVAVGLVPTEVGEADTGVLPVPPPGLPALPVIAVGVDPVPVLGELPPQAATIINKPNNTKLNQMPG